MSEDQASNQPGAGEEDLVTLRLREMLFRGDFPPGSKLVESALAERLGVSRMPVRRALAILQRDGLVDGWMWLVEGQEVLLCGSYCDGLKATGNVDAFYGCPTSG